MKNRAKKKSRRSDGTQKSFDFMTNQVSTRMSTSGAEEVRLAVKAAVRPREDLGDIARLAAMDPMQYDRVRKDEAKRLGVRPGTLDVEVEKARTSTAKNNVQRDGGLAPPAPEPWSDPVDGAALLDDIRSFLGRFIVADDPALDAVTLWIAFTYLLDAAETSPRLAILSPTKRCGKTRLLDLLNALTCRPVCASNLSPSTIFRTIDAEHPTMLIDEADTFARDNDELRGLLNSGHSRTSAYFARSRKVGDDWNPKKFSTWAAIAVAAIGKLPDTWLDRSILINMRRKLRGHTIGRLRRRDTQVWVEASELARKMARWAVDNSSALEAAEPAIPEALADRAADNWELLLAIADRAGGSWPNLGRRAAISLSGDHETADAASLSEKLLADTRTIFDRRGGLPISSRDLVAALVGMEQRPWSEVSRDRPLTTARLARMVKDFGVYPKQRSAGSYYVLGDFEDAFARYAPAPNNQTAILPQPLGPLGEMITTCHRMAP
jgi:putative DNA primase/helicase